VRPGTPLIAMPSRQLNRPQMPNPLRQSARIPGQSVVQVVQNSMLRAAQKTHATRSTTVNSGLLRSTENAHHAASSCKGAGRKVGPRRCGLFFAKVMLNLVSRFPSPTPATSHRALRGEVAAALWARLGDDRVPRVSLLDPYFWAIRAGLGIMKR
jgi:hypothetical protein